MRCVFIANKTFTLTNTLKDHTNLKKWDLLDTRVVHNGLNQFCTSVPYKNKAL